MSRIDVGELLEQLNNVSSSEDICRIASEFCQTLGFDHFFYGALLPTSYAKPTLVIVTDQPEEWRQHYHEQDYLSVDPTAAHCLENITPLLWQDLKPLIQDSPVVKSLFSEAEDFGIRSGASIPLHSYSGEAAMLSLTNRTNKISTQKNIIRALPDANLLACYLHEAYLRLLRQHQPLKDNPLTERERECLLWTTEGKTSWEISQILNISERTVNFHISNTMYKLQVNNKQHAIAKAISMGLIQFVL